MSALSKAEIAENLINQTGISKRDAKQAVEDFFDAIATALIEGESVKISGFGNFDLRQKSQRPGRNPKTGEIVAVTARKVVTFRAGQKFRIQLEILRAQHKAKLKLS